MGKIALLVSREEMIHQAHNILQEKKFEIQEMRVIHTGDTVMEARRSIADGATIIIARGLQASIIKQYTDTPVVEIVLTAQEMALLIMRAKQIAGKEKPVVAVVGFRNMFCDMSYFDELYNIELKTYFADQGAELPVVVRRAISEGADVVIGGDTAVSIATEAGVPSLFLSMTEDSMRQAFSTAENMEYAMNVEKKTAAQLETLLDYSYSGVIRLDGNGVITAVNPLMEDMIGKKEEELKGENIRKAAPMIGEEAWKRVFEKGEDYSLFFEWGGTPIFAVLAPVLYESRADGAIVTCHKMKKKTVAPEKSRMTQKRENSRALPPLVQFEDILQKSTAMQECIRKANLYALSEHPVVLIGEPGTEKRMLAESIHNSSIRAQGPFLDVRRGTEKYDFWKPRCRAAGRGWNAASSGCGGTDGGQSIPPVSAHSFPGLPWRGYREPAKSRRAGHGDHRLSALRADGRAKDQSGSLLSAVRPGIVCAAAQGTAGRFTGKDRGHYSRLL